MEFRINRFVCVCVCVRERERENKRCGFERGFENAAAAAAVYVVLGRSEISEISLLPPVLLFLFFKNDQGRIYEYDGLTYLYESMGYEVYI